MRQTSNVLPLPKLRGRPASGGLNPEKPQLPMIDSGGLNPEPHTYGGKVDVFSKQASMKAHDRQKLKNSKTKAFKLRGCSSKTVTKQSLLHARRFRLRHPRPKMSYQVEQLTRSGDSMSGIVHRFRRTGMLPSHYVILGLPKNVTLADRIECGEELDRLFNKTANKLTAAEQRCLTTSENKLSLRRAKSDVKQPGPKVKVVKCFKNNQKSSDFIHISPKARNNGQKIDEALPKTLTERDVYAMNLLSKGKERVEEDASPRPPTAKQSREAEFYYFNCPEAYDGFDECVKQTAVVEAPSAPMEATPVSRNLPGACYFCGKPGHKQANCFHNPSSTNYRPAAKFPDNNTPAPAASAAPAAPVTPDLPAAPPAGRKLLGYQISDDLLDEYAQDRLGMSNSEESWFNWITRTSSDYSISRSCVDHEYVGETRLVQQRNVKVIEQDVIVEEATFVAHDYHFSCKRLQYTVPVILAIVISQLLLSYYFTLPLVILLAFLIVRSRKTRSTTTKMTWCPHMLSCIYSELGSSNSTTLGQSALGIAKRISCLPLDDIIYCQVRDGSAEMAVFLAARGESNFIQGQQLRGHSSPQYMLA